jgi:Helicase conserved C-terminal domain
MARAPDYQPLAYCYYLSRRIASRGLYIDGVTHVVNFELPQVAEAYVHRISRPALDPLA